MKHKQSGFTLVEIAIVLVIIGLLLGGILKGQEMIVSGQVRNMISQGDGATAAIFAFQDRFKALPGDFAAATTSLPGGGGTADGDGNGAIDTVEEMGDAWEHMSFAGFLAGSFDGNDTLAVPANWTCASTTCPPNTFGGTMVLVTDDEAFGSAVNRLELYSGQNIPIGVMLEIDTKVDDGNPVTGSFQVSDTHAAVCEGGTLLYDIVTTPDAQCGGVYRNF